MFLCEGTLVPNNTFESPNNSVFFRLFDVVEDLIVGHDFLVLVIVD